MKAVKRRPNDTTRRRRNYRVERLPFEARERVLEGFKAGKDYTAIRAELARRGVKISTTALSNYWRDRFQIEEDRLRAAQAMTERIENAMKEKSGTSLAVMGRELLFSRVLEKLGQLDKASIWQLLREARELARATRGQTLVPKRNGAIPASRAKQTREMRRRWRELYGLEEPDEHKQQSVKRSQG